MSGAGDGAEEGAGRPGYWSRLLDSPLRDVVRLRATGRCDVKGAVRRAGLPAEMEALVLRVVRRTRLWRLEKVDVARELAVHFADGLEEGRSAGELIDAFGDEKSAARLIRRAKRRQRHIVWQAWLWTRRVLGALVVMMLVGYGWLAYVYFTSKPVISHDYFADLNAKAASWRPEERAWPLYREAIAALQPWPEELWRKCRDPLACSTHRAALVEWLGERAGALAMVREAAGRPGMGLKITAGISEEDRPLWPEPAVAVGETAEEGQAVALAGSLLMSLLPHLSESRSIARALGEDAVWAAQSGDGERAAENVWAMVRLAEHTREMPVLVNDLVSLAMLTQASDVTNRLLREYPGELTNMQLQLMAHALAAFSGGGVIRVNLEGERLGFRDVVQRVYSDDGRGGGRMIIPQRVLYELMGGEPESKRRLSPAAVMGPLVMAASAPRNDLLARYDMLVDAACSTANLTLIERRAEVARIEAEFNLDTDSVFESNRYFLVYMLAPAMTSVMAQGDLAAMRRDATLAAITLELYRREHGGYPATLAELTARFMPSVPVDQFVGRPMGYRLDEAGEPIIYSVGNDGEDDGGRLSAGFATAREANDAAAKWQELTRGPKPDGDWILYPPQPEEPPKHRYPEPDQFDEDQGENTGGG